MSYHHFTLKEHASIEIFLNLGYSHWKIAPELGRHHSSINREIKRGSEHGKYVCEIAAQRHIQRRSSSKPAGKRTVTLYKKISENMN